MNKIAIENIRPYDGDYPLDLDDEPLTTLEWRWVKKISGYLPLTIDEGLRGGDPDVVCALAVVALRRAGKITKGDVFTVADELADAPFDGSAIRLVFDEVASGDDVPPPTAAPEPQKSSGGGSSSPILAPSESDLSPIGAPV